ncbi:alkaline shock response membrane anchor protein AmaP [Paenibacillus puerhi]|uniref:alkaline shock response membrane anchor protein AmaP n=1 Tax=Paenibacillus puerhi TaxID=2692622 RepID=UPI001358508D|nr:alkaline shock response membrane anchor protein AmaP [Paenibacillus puerhi]
MAKVLDKFLLFLLSLIVLIAALIALFAAFGWVSLGSTKQFAEHVYEDFNYAIPFIVTSAVAGLLALRFLYVSVRRGKSSVPSIDQRTEFGDIRISLDTVENLSLKAASRSRGVRDLRARVKVNQAGLEIVIRAIVDGETPIPGLTEEMQANVKGHIEEITGIPVAFVSVFIANIQQSAPTFKSRVE